MFRISRITDYGIVILAQLAAQNDDAAHNSRVLSDQTQLPTPVVSKILKTLTREGLLDSVRGSKGGYRLARPPAQISVVEMITALEGPVGMTECASHPGACSMESSCGLQGPWQRINGAVQDALEKITLADLADSNANSRGGFDRFVPLVGLDSDGVEPSHEDSLHPPHEDRTARTDPISKEPRGR